MPKAKLSSEYAACFFFFAYMYFSASLTTHTERERDLLGISKPHPGYGYSYGSQMQREAVFPNQGWGKGEREKVTFFELTGCSCCCSRLIREVSGQGRVKRVGLMGFAYVSPFDGNT